MFLWGRSGGWVRVNVRVKVEEVRVIVTVRVKRFGLG